MTALQYLMDRRRVGHPKANPIGVRLGRRELPKLCKTLGYTRGAEIGVWRGAFSKLFAEQGLHWLAIDPWDVDQTWQDMRNMLPPDQGPARMEAVYQDACARLAPYPSCRILRQSSRVAAHLVPDRSLDLVYIDGNHAEAAALEDIELWMPKVRSGGILAGHDYRAFENKPTIHVIEAVQAFTQAHAIAPWFLLINEPTPSWCWVKH